VSADKYAAGVDVVVESALCGADLVGALAV
jgi:hypothetical protein